MISVDKPGMPARLPESLLDGVVDHAAADVGAQRPTLVAQLAPMSRR
jgi:hypothetical protein